jgi:hypothetical protein
VKIGDLVRLKNFDNDVYALGIVLDTHKISANYDNPSETKTLAIEYRVGLITNNKAAWYIEDSLELINEGRRFGKK